MEIQSGIHEKIDRLLQIILDKLNKGDLLSSIIENSGVYIYVADIDSYEMIYMNDALINVFGNRIGEPCYEIMQGFSEVCSFCKNGELLEFNEVPIKYAQYNKKIKEFVLCYDTFKRVNGNRVKVEIAYPITDIIPEIIHIIEKYNLKEI